MVICATVRPYRSYNGDVAAEYQIGRELLGAIPKGLGALWGVAFCETNADLDAIGEHGDRVSIDDTDDAASVGLSEQGCAQGEKKEDGDSPNARHAVTSWDLSGVDSSGRPRVKVNDRLGRECISYR